MQGILDPRFLLFHLDLRGGANSDNRHAPDDLGQPLLELLPVIVRFCLLDLRPDLLHAPFDVSAVAGAVHDGGIVLVNSDLLASAQILKRDVL